MSEILIIQIINLFIQLIFDIVLKLINRVCIKTNTNNLTFWGVFVQSIIGSTYKIIFYLLSTIILLSIFNKNIFINGLILFLSFFLYIFIHFKIQYFGC